jgi:hypothetical protein
MPWCLKNLTTFWRTPLEDGSSRFLRNVVQYFPYYITPHTRQFTSFINVTIFATGRYSKPIHVGFVVDEGALGQFFFSKYFGFSPSVTLSQ